MWPRLTKSDLQLAQPFSPTHLKAGFVYFDAGNVILDLDWDSYFEATAKLVTSNASHFTMENFTKTMLKSGLARKWSCGLIGNAQFSVELKNLLVSEFSIDTRRASEIFPQRLKEISSLVVGPPRMRVFELIKSLKQKGFFIGLLSNCNPWHEVDIERNRSLYDLFDAVVYSHDVGCEKPELEIYEIATRIAAATVTKKRDVELIKSDIYFVDDLPANVRAARNFGWNASLVTLVRGDFLEALRNETLSSEQFEQLSVRASSLVFGDAAARRVESVFSDLLVASHKLVPT